MAITIWRKATNLGVKVVDDEPKYMKEIIGMEKRDQEGKRVREANLN